MKCIKSENLLLIMTIVGVLSGIGLGIGLKFGMDRTPTLSPREVAYLRFPGEIFLRMLKMLILPLITSSLINSLASLDSETAGRMGLVATIYYMSTTLIAVITGIVLVVIIKPGSYAETIKTGSSEGGESCKGTEPLDTIMDLFRNMFPENIEVAGFQSVRKTFLSFSQRFSRSEQEMWDVVPYQSMKDGMNILGLVIFSLVFGFIINRMGETALPLANFFRALEAVIMRMVTIVIW
uniref:Amino acid transporter n=1 Tax=Plectus sambesii TaxID=2011161 RepID=A0A914WP40_9BILA